MHALFHEETHFRDTAVHFCSCFIAAFLVIREISLERLLIDKSHLSLPLYVNFTRGFYHCESIPSDTYVVSHISNCDLRVGQSFVVYTETKSSPSFRSRVSITWVYRWCNVSEKLLNFILCTVLQGRLN